MGSMWDIGRKQLEDTFSSKKFLLIMGLFLLLSLASVYLGVQNYNQRMENFRQEGFRGDIPEKPSLVDVFEIMVSFNLPLAAGVLALLLSYDSVSREREEGTIELLLSYPVYRDEVINGKFAAGLFTVALALLIAFTASSGLAIYLTGALPTMQEVYRIMFMWQGSVVYMAFFFGLGTLYSTIFRSSWRSLIAGMVTLLIFIATPFIAGFAADFIYPMKIDQGAVQQRTTAYGDMAAEVQSNEAQRRQDIIQKRKAFREKISRFSPSTSYRNFVKKMLGTSYSSETGLKPGVWESLSAGIGYLVFLLSETMLMFSAAYAVFMRQDL
ncbi:MAG: ABC transporter permease subunit [Candidatus Nanohaloarchaea archaeon]